MTSPAPPNQQSSLAYAATPPAPPPKPATSSSPITQAPPRPPPPPRQPHSGIRETDPGQAPLQNQVLQDSASATIPAVESGWLPEILKEKSIQDLQRVLADPSLQAALLANDSTTHPSITASEQALQPLISANIALASTTQDLEAQLASMRRRTQERLLALRALEQQHRTKIVETEAAIKDFSAMALYERLNSSAQEQEHLVAGMEESWLEEDGVASDREVGEFVKRVKDARKVAFLRLERKRRWDEGRVSGVR